MVALVALLFLNFMNERFNNACYSEATVSMVREERDSCLQS